MVPVQTQLFGQLLSVVQVLVSAGLADNRARAGPPKAVRVIRPTLRDLQRVPARLKRNPGIPQVVGQVVLVREAGIPLFLRRVPLGDNSSLTKRRVPQGRVLHRTRGLVHKSAGVVRRHMASSLRLASQSHR